MISASVVSPQITASVSGNNISATVSGGDFAAASHAHAASEITSGTLSDERLSDNARAAINLYLWSNFR